MRGRYRRVFFGLLLVAGAELYAERVMIVGGGESLPAAEKKAEEVENFIRKHPEFENGAAGLEVQKRSLYGVWLVEVAPLPEGKRGEYLLFAFSSRFPDLIVVHENREEGVAKRVAEKKTAALSDTKRSVSVTQPGKKEAEPGSFLKGQKRGDEEKRFFISGKEMQWISLVVMAMIGLILVVRSSRQVARIRELQKRLEEDQRRLQAEMEKGSKHD